MTTFEKIFLTIFIWTSIASFYEAVTGGVGTTTHFAASMLALLTGLAFIFAPGKSG